MEAFIPSKTRETKNGRFLYLQSITKTILWGWRVLMAFLTQDLKWFHFQQSNLSFWRMSGTSLWHLIVTKWTVQIKCASSKCHVPTFRISEKSLFWLRNLYLPWSHQHTWGLLDPWGARLHSNNPWMTKSFWEIHFCSTFLVRITLAPKRFLLELTLTLSKKSM